MDEKGGQRTMKATEFKAKCLRLMDEVSNGGGEIVITKRGVPVARLTPYQQKPAKQAPRKKIPKTLFGVHKDRHPWLQEVIDDMERGVTVLSVLNEMEAEYQKQMDGEPC